MLNFARKLYYMIYVILGRDIALAGQLSHLRRPQSQLQKLAQSVVPRGIRALPHLILQNLLKVRRMSYPIIPCNIPSGFLEKMIKTQSSDSTQSSKSRNFLLGQIPPMSWLPWATLEPQNRTTSTTWKWSTSEEVSYEYISLIFFKKLFLH